jgi:ACS family D-galactonate transporter-like MFS transporter
MRWWMLLVLSLGFVVLTLNWFDIASAFPALGQQFHLQIAQLALLISLFIAGYGICHIPTGFLAYRFGLRNVLLAGLLIESLGAIASAFAPTYAWLGILRVITGIGGAFFVGCGFSLVTSWFRGRELALAMGIATGGAFTLGIALGLFVWVGIVQAAGWSVALALGGGIGLLAFLVSLIFLRVPSDEQEQLAAGRFSWTAVGRVLGNRDLWLLGVSFAGLYGAGFTLAQLLNVYVPAVYHVSEATSGLMAAVFTLSAVPGSIIGGYLFDRAKRAKLVIIVPWLVAGLGLIIFPFMNLFGLWIMMIVLGGVPYAGFSGWAAAPGRYRDRVLPEDVATAGGVLLTLAAVGGFLVPIGIGQIAGASGFTWAWIFGGAISIICALVGFAVREPARATTSVDQAVESVGQPARLTI